MRSTRRRLASVAILVSLGSCAAGSEESSYCADLSNVLKTLDQGGTEADYNQLLARIVDESPSEHAQTWALMLKLSQDPFTYDNFNPAVDSLDRISVDLKSTCSGLDRMIVDDAGRMRQWLAE